MQDYETSFHHLVRERAVVRAELWEEVVMSWQDVRLATEDFRQDLWGTLVTGSTSTVPCEATSPEDKKPLQRNNVMPERPVIITVTNADYLLMGSPALRDIVTWNEDIYMIYAINDDPADATVDMRCILKV